MIDPDRWTAQQYRHFLSTGHEPGCSCRSQRDEAGGDTGGEANPEGEEDSRE